MEMTPRVRRDFIKIEDVPSNKPSLKETFWDGEDEPTEEDFAIDDGSYVDSLEQHDQMMREMQ
jgi:hypothetical protein